MTLTVLPFRPGDTTPSVEEVAALLVAAVPEVDRKIARRLLVDRILPVKMSGISHHPRPQRLASVVYKELARTLSGKPVNMRLHALQLAALDADILAMSRHALHLAIARYLAEHPEAAHSEQVQPWVKNEVEDLQSRSVTDLARQAQVQLDELGAWQRRVKAEYPSEWEKHLVKSVQVREALNAAHRGSFDTATGGLQDFLRDADPSYRSNKRS